MAKTSSSKAATEPRLLYPRELLRQFLKRRKSKLSSAATHALSTVLDAVFFASLMVEEGEPVRVAVVYVEEGAEGLEKIVDNSPGEEETPTWDVTRFETQRLTATALAKFSRAFEYGRQLAVIGGRGNKLQIEGVARRLPRTDGGDVVRIAAPRPGVLVFERGLQELFRFDAGTFAEPRIDVLGEAGPVREALARISGVAAGGVDSVSYVERAMYQLLPRIRAHGAGAIVAITPTAPSAQMLKATKYKRTNPPAFFERLSADEKQSWAYVWARLDAAGGDVPRDTAVKLEIAREESEQARMFFETAIEDVARLSAVDGAVLLGPSFMMYGGGYLIPSVESEKIPRTERASNASASQTKPYTGSHGARHKAAFSFACLHPEGLAFVISEDGPINCVMMHNERLVVWPVQILET